MILERARACVSNATIKDYQQNGVVCLRGLLNEDELNLLTSGIELNLSALSPRAKILSKDQAGLFIEDFCNWQENPYYHSFILQSPLAAAALLLLQSNSIRLYHDHLLVKKSGTKQRTPWHQDQPYYNITGKQACSFWIPIDPISDELALEFIAGSHDGTWYMPRTFINNEAKWFSEGSLKEVPNIDMNREAFPIVKWALNPGDVICFHMLTLHSAPAAISHLRRVFSLRLLGDDIRHAPRPWPTSPDFPGLEKELPANAAMDHPLFPELISISTR